MRSGWRPSSPTRSAATRLPCERLAAGRGRHNTAHPACLLCCFGPGAAPACRLHRSCACLPTASSSFQAPSLTPECCPLLAAARSYGDGFRLAHEAFQAQGLPAVLAHVQRLGAFPPA